MKTLPKTVKFIKYHWRHCAIFDPANNNKHLFEVAQQFGHEHVFPNDPTPGDLCLLFVALSRKEKEMENQMNIEVSSYHRVWTLAGGVYDISMDVRHSCYDVIKSNAHMTCTHDLTLAVEWILKDQGWCGGVDVAKIAKMMADDMHVKTGELVKKAIALGQMKPGE
jgi:hypothetical protein